MDSVSSRQVCGGQLSGGVARPRPLTLSDLPQVSDILEKSFSRPWRFPEISYFLSHPQGLSLGQFNAQGGLEAYLFGLLVQGDFDLASLATRPENRRQGLSQSLLLCVMNRPDVSRFFLEVASDNNSAQALYAKLGFEKIGLRKNYYEGAKDAVVMRWIQETIRGSEVPSRRYEGRRGKEQYVQRTDSV